MGRSLYEKQHYLDGLSPHSSHLTQQLDVGVSGPLKTLIASAIEPLISTELHRILKAEWLSAYVEAHDKAFSRQNIEAGFRGTGIQPFNPEDMLDHIRPIVEDLIVVRHSTAVADAAPFKKSVLQALLFIMRMHAWQTPLY